MSKQAYVKVSKDVKDTPAQSADLKTDGPGNLKGITARFLKGNKGNTSKTGKNNTVSIWIHERQTSTSGNNAALTAVITCTPLNLAEAKSLATLYDAARCKAVRFQFHVNTATSGGTPTQPTLDADGIVVWDYAVSTAMSSVVAGMDFRHGVGPFSANPASYASSPAAVTPTGFLKSDLIKLTPTPIVDPGILSDFLGGNWVGSADTGVQIGFIKMYIEPAGSNIYTTNDVYISYLMEYKNRG